MGYRITLNTSAGELDGRYAETEDDIKGALLALVKACEFRDGDTIQIREAVGSDTFRGRIQNALTFD